MNQREIPSIGRIVDRYLKSSATSMAPPTLVALIRDCVEHFRESLDKDSHLTIDQLHQMIEGKVQEHLRQNLQRTINATGILLHTNLGRAPIAAQAIRAVTEIATGYCNLEYDLASGKRGQRGKIVRQKLAQLCGSDDAVLVNNGAGAIYLVLRALACGGEVILSRGEMVQIGGGFRIPDLLRESGARLVEVGCTNITTIDDYEKAITEQTKMLLVVHQSNFAMSGHCGKPSLRELSAVAKRHQLPLVFDLGSGALVDWPGRRSDVEPLVSEAIAQGCDVVVFSGDKILGGPQAGVICARRNLAESCHKHPMARLLRLCKMNLAAIEATLDLYLQGRASDIPIQRMLQIQLDEIEERAERLAQKWRSCGIATQLVEGVSQIGGGTSPLSVVPTCLIEIETDASVADSLRMARVPVVARFSRGRIVLDLRSVMPEDDDLLYEQVRCALQLGGGADHQKP